MYHSFLIHSSDGHLGCFHVLAIVKCYDEHWGARVSFRSGFLGHHTFFIHSSVDEHLGCFHVSVTVSSAAVNIGVHVSFWVTVFVFSRYMPRDRIARSCATLFLVFWGTFLLFSLMAASMYISTSSIGVFPTSSPVFSICLSDFKTLAFVSRSLIITLLGMDLGKLSWCVLTWNLLGVWPIDLCFLSNGKFSPSISINSSQPCSFFFPVIWI